MNVAGHASSRITQWSLHGTNYLYMYLCILEIYSNPHSHKAVIFNAQALKTAQPS